MLLSRLKTRLLQFARQTEGTASVEAMIVFPALLVLFAMSWVYFDVMRQQSINQKANYTIGDMVSRETDMLDEAYISNAQRLLFHLTKSSGTDLDLRITAVQYDADVTGPDAYSVIWSKARGDWTALTDADLAGYADHLPAMADAEQVILVETRDLYVPTYDFAGLGPFDIETYSFTRPRFSPQVVFEGINDGSNSGSGGIADPNPA